MTGILGLKQNKWIAGAALLLTTCSLQAQEQPNVKEKFERGNWSVPGALNGEWMTKIIDNVYAGGKVFGGVYLTPFSGFRATAEIGKNRIENNAEATQLSINLDCMLTLTENNGFKRFNLTAILGAGFNYYDFGDNDPKYIRINIISGNFSTQTSYNVNRKFSVFIESGLKILSKYYNKEPNNKIYMQSNLTIGLAYTFRDKYRKSIDNGTQPLYMPETDLLEIKQKVGILCEEVI